MTKLNLEVENGDSYPDYEWPNRFHLELTTDLFMHLAHLAKVVKDNDMLFCKILFHEGEWVAESEDGDKELYPVSPSVVVHSTSFQFVAYGSKYVDDKLFTDSIPFSLINITLEDKEIT